ncbi:hypothetical protein PoB_006318400 [Plakobranchus ocellatus]|uniref:Uncharacterized protein n=1 Tax=Plakobranchus ocellatus TaxID=259542 RepID=A0AAV4CXP4_9GAST|nr:hypothetical protein PoB_006318400 [Plakobranchus ocellatus]
MLRYKRFWEKVTTSITTVQVRSLSPTSAAAKYHSLRVYLKVQDWIDTTCDLQPEMWGWQLSSGRFDPCTTDLPPAPELLLKMIRCNCKCLHRLRGLIRTRRYKEDFELHQTELEAPALRVFPTRLEPLGEKPHTPFISSFFKTDASSSRDTPNNFFITTEEKDPKTNQNSAPAYPATASRLWPS